MSWLLRRVVSHKKSGKRRFSNGESSDLRVKNLKSDHLQAQKKTFTRWCNAQLSRAPDIDENPNKYIIDDLQIDLQDGIRLLKLLEILSGEQLPRPEKSGKIIIRIHRILNVGKALTFLQSKLNEPLPNIGSEDIVDGNLKLTMGLIWVIILRFKIGLIAEKEQKNIENESELEIEIYPQNKEEMNNDSDRMSYEKSNINKEQQVKKETDDVGTSWDSDDEPQIIDISKKRNTKKRRSTFRRSMFKRSSYGDDKVPVLPKRQSIRKAVLIKNTAANAKSSLLSWCKTILKPYVELKIINQINDFSKSWQNGVAFLALVHKMQPTIMPEIEELVQAKNNNEEYSIPSLYTSDDQEDWFQNLYTAFQIAEKCFGIAQLIDVNDICRVDTPDERIIMTYISEFYFAFERNYNNKANNTNNNVNNLNIVKKESTVEVTEEISNDQSSIKSNEQQQEKEDSVTEISSVSGSDTSGNSRVTYRDERTEEDFEQDKEYQVRIAEFNTKSVDVLLNELENIIHSYLEKANNFSGWVKETQQVQYQLLWFLYSPPQDQSQQQIITPQPSYVSRIYEPLYNVNSSIDILESVIGECMSVLRTELENINFSSAKGGVMKRELDREFLLVSEIARTIEKKNKSTDEIANISTIYATQSSILQHLSRLISHTFVSASNVLQNFVLWVKEWEVVLDCVEEDLLNEEKKDDGRPESLRSEVNRWMQNVNSLVEQIGSLLVKREKYILKRKTDLENFTKNSDNRLIERIRQRWMIIHTVVRDILGDDYVPDISSFILSSTVSIPDTDYFVELEMELTNLSRTLNNDYPAKLDNLHQRVESLVSFVTAEFTRRPLLSRRAFPDLPLGGIAQLARIPTLSSVPPPNLQFSNFPAFVLLHADKLIKSGQNEVLKPLELNVIDTINKQKETVNSLLENVRSHRKESVDINEILLQEEQNEKEKLQIIQSLSNEYCRMVKRLEDWISGTEKDFQRIKEQIPGVLSRLQDREGNFREADLTWIRGTEDWCKSILNDIKLLSTVKSNQSDSDFNSPVPSQARLDQTWKKLFDLIFYLKPEKKKLLERKETKQYIDIPPFHNKVSTHMKELEASVDIFIKKFLSPSKKSLGNQIDMKLQDLVEQWKTQSKDMQNFIETNMSIRCGEEPDEETDDIVFKELEITLKSWTGIEYPSNEDNISSILKNEEDFKRKLTGLQQRLTQMSCVNSDSALSPLSVEIGKFKKYTWTKFNSLSADIIKKLPSEGDKHGLSRQLIKSRLETLNTQLNQLIEMDAEYLSQHTQVIKHKTKDVKERNNELETFITIVGMNVEWIKTIEKLNNELNNESHIVMDLERVKTTSQHAVDMLMCEDEEINNEDSEYLSLAKPILNECQQRLKESIYKDISKLDTLQVERNEIISNIQMNEKSTFITKFLKEKYCEIHMNYLNIYDDKARILYMNAQNMVSCSTQWYNIYRQMFDWIVYADRTRADTEERILRYSQGGSRAVPNGLDDDVNESLIVQCEKDQNHLEEKTKEWKENPRFKKVQKLYNRLIEHLNDMSNSNSSIITAEKSKTIEAYVTAKLKKFNDVLDRFSQTIRKRKHDVIRLRKVFTDVSQPCKLLLSEIEEIEEELNGVNTIIKNKQYSEEGVSHVIKTLNERTMEVTIKCNDLDKVIKNMSESYPESPDSSYKHVSMLLRPIIDTRVFELVHDVSQKGLILKKKMGKTVSALTKIVIDNWENDIIIELQNWIEKTQADLERSIDEEKDNDVLELYIEKYKKYQQEVEQKRDLLTQAENKTETLVKTLRSWAISSNNKTQSINRGSRASNRLSIRSSFIRTSRSSFMSNHESLLLPKRISNIVELPSQPDLLHIRFTELSKSFNVIVDHIEHEVKYFDYSSEVFKEIKTINNLINKLKDDIKNVKQIPSTKERDTSIEEQERNLKELEENHLNKTLIGMIEHITELQSESPTKGEIKINAILKKEQLELSESFENIHKQIMNMKRSKKIVEGYIKQSQEVRQWIQEKLSVLTEVNDNLNEQCERFKEIKNKYDKNLEDGVNEEELRIVYKTEESVFDSVMEKLSEAESSLKRYTLSYQHLKSHAGKIINDCELSIHNTLSKESFDIIKTHQRGVDVIWTNLCNELERLKNISTIRMNIMNWIKKSEKFEKSIWDLEEKLEQGEGLIINNNEDGNEENSKAIPEDPFTEFGQVIDETIRSWDYDVSRLEEEYEILSHSIQEIELNALKFDCPQEIDVLNQKWYLNNINESLSSLQDTFDGRKDEIFDLSEKLDQWQLDLHQLEEWIEVTTVSLNERLNDTNSGYAIISGDSEFDSVNLANWIKSQSSLENQINGAILTQYENVTSTFTSLSAYCNDLLPKDTTEIFSKWMSEKRTHLYDEWQSLSILKDNEKKALSVSKQYYEWHQNIIQIESGINEKLESLNFKENCDYNELSDSIDHYDKMFNEASQKIKCLKIEKSKIVYEKMNNEIYKTRHNQITQKINDARKLIQDAKETSSRKQSLQEVNSKLEKIEKWCSSTLYSLPLLSSCIECICNSRKKNNDLNLMPVIDIDEMMESILREFETMEKFFSLSSIEYSYQNSILKYSIAEKELEKNSKELNTLREKYQKYFRSYNNSPQIRYENILQRFKNVEKTINHGNNKIDIFKKVYTHDKITVILQSWIHNKKENIIEIMNNQQPSLLTNKILEVESQVNIFETTIMEYNTLCDKLFNSLSVIEEQNIDVHKYSQIITERKKNIGSEWEMLLELLKCLKSNSNYIEKEIELNKLEIEIMKSMEDIKNRILEVGQFKNREIELNDLDGIFGRLEGELIAGVLPNIQKFERNIKQIPYEMSTNSILYKRKVSLKELFDSLTGILHNRKNRLRISRKVQSHNKLLENIEQQLNELSRIVDEPMSSRGRNEVETYIAIVDSKLMYYDTCITKLITESNEQMKYIISTDTADEWNSCERQQNIEKIWEEIKQVVKDRKESIDNKLLKSVSSEKSNQRMSTYLPKHHSIRSSNIFSSRSGKSSPKNLYSRSNYRRSPHNTTSNTSSNGNSNNGSSSTSISASLNNNTNKNINNNSSIQSSMINKSPSLNGNINDSNDQLDIEMARIIKESPVSVKVVPAGYGKYFFGEKSPKLCYCRYLRSGVIMVHYNGGWSELGKFLLEFDKQN